MEQNQPNTGTTTQPPAGQINVEPSAQQAPTKKRAFSEFWTTKITTEEQAIKIIHSAANAFYILAAIDAILGVLISLAYVLDACIFALLAFFFNRSKNRWLGVLLSMLSLFAVITTFLNSIGSNHVGGTNMVLAFILLATAIRSTYAAFVFHSLRKPQI